MLTLVTLIAVALGLPFAVLGFECWLALLPLRRQSVNEDTVATGIRIAVVIPAHDEQERIATTIQRVKQQVDDDAAVIVVADNCTDATAERAAAAGATVWLRDDVTLRGKGFALSYAFDRLNGFDPDVVVCLDADCAPGPNCIRTIAVLAQQRQRPVQAAYTMYASEVAGGLTGISALAVFVKNYLRPRGLQRLGLPCLLTGSGMAFPKSALSAMRRPDGNIVEDMRMSTDLAVAGFAPLPCMEVSLDSPLPDRQSGFLSQRTRWEHGHMSMILNHAPRLLAACIRSASPRLLVLLLELIVPPLSFLLLSAVAIVALLTLASSFMNEWSPLVYFLAETTIGVSGLLSVWFRFGRRILPPAIALRIPQYVAVKAPMYLRFVNRPQRVWIRTERNPILAEVNLALPTSQPVAPIVSGPHAD